LASWHALKVELARVEGDGADVPVVWCKIMMRRERSKMAKDAVAYCLFTEERRRREAHKSDAIFALMTNTDRLVLVHVKWIGEVIMSLEERD
jgi:hypothetical protein